MLGPHPSYDRLTARRWRTDRAPSRPSAAYAHAPTDTLIPAVAGGLLDAAAIVGALALVVGLVWLAGAVLAVLTPL